MLDPQDLRPNRTSYSRAECERFVPQDLDLDLPGSEPGVLPVTLGTNESPGGESDPYHFALQASGLPLPS